MNTVTEDYLKTIYKLQRTEGAPVSTSDIADRLDRSGASVTSMLDKLAERGLVEREKYKGAELTAEGETVALEVIRHHRLLEAYLTEHLDYSWSEVHDEAERLEHHISEEFERRVAEVLGHPTSDPHGDPIPGEDLSPPEDDTSPLLDHGEGTSVTVARVADRDEAELEYLADAGITPGTHLDVTDVAPFGMVTVRTDDGEQSLPEDVAESIRVRESDPAENGGAGRDEGVGGA
ncbi:MAG: metal-dependent transcriptional regulator [Haloferacaceae archaeon]